MPRAKRCRCCAAASGSWPELARDGGFGLAGVERGRERAGDLVELGPRDHERRRDLERSARENAADDSVLAGEKEDLLCQGRIGQLNGSHHARSGTGVMAAVQLTDPALAEKVLLLAREHGVVSRVLAGGALQVSPPLVITRAELDEIAGAFAASLDACQTEAAVAG